MIFLGNFLWKTDPSSDEWGMSSKMKKIEYQTRLVRPCFNRVIEMNQKMWIFKRFVTNNVFLCDDDNRNVNRILLQYKVVLIAKIWWQHVCYWLRNWYFKYCFIFFALGKDTSTPGSIERPQRCDRGVTGGRSLTLHSGQTGN